jgi:2-polyprenyl-6-methoxyphenol hydroxylase-like FAD-dependent oxidoreductase
MSSGAVALRDAGARRCGPRLSHRLPDQEQSALVSPTLPACVPQDHLEPVVLDHLRSLAAGRVELGSEVVRVEHRPDGVRVALRDVDGGRSRFVDARSGMIPAA